MTNDFEATTVAVTAAELWRSADGPGGFPRDVVATVPWVLPLAIELVFGLTTERVLDWLRHRAICPPAIPNRPLQACLIARGGTGVIVLEGNDSDAERRYSAAHEIGHFVLDHLAPRDAVAATLGPSAVAVLDGRRAATADERLSALLRGVPLKPLTHLLARDEAGCPPTLTDDAEIAADGFALELLAPQWHALRSLGDVSRGVRGEQLAAAGARLATVFGLPPAVARSYARRLLWARSGSTLLRDWLLPKEDVAADPTTFENTSAPPSHFPRSCGT